MSLHAIAAQTVLSLAEVSCTQPFGEGCDVYKVMDKVFMLRFHLQGKAAINLKVEPEHGEMLRDIYPYIRSGWHMNKKHWITVFEEADLDKSLLQELILNSYELVVARLHKAEQQRIEMLKNIQ
ncbi:MmcQ/YjbR family DNA-binding protein [Acinetobacter sp. ASP199]|uniref:MmcQ/YjbR family DNA-binding protein n=1 Tax=unclassified Acinetobacter TaxID=196816 RepID=UPI001F602E1A|nr:MmcQ/YjbR family DNA-binding protein [Acinetobacter sp. ASP199]UNT58767.1 MmcQ/YjbR family DNA-binding protein [Acinetobacter sp. ASP199]